MACTRRRVVGAGLLAVLAALVTVLPPTASAGTSPADYAARMLVLVNNARSSHGLASVAAARGTAEVADGWATELMRRQALAHNPDLQSQLETHGSPDWHTYGEVVGHGPADDPDAVFAGYMQSSEHRSVILDPAMRFIGIGVRDDGPGAWNVLDFVDTYRDASTGTTGPAAPAPAPTATAPTPAAPAAPAPRPQAAPAPAPAARSTAGRPAPDVRAVAATAAAARGDVRDPHGWVTAVPLQHHNRALPAALVSVSLPAGVLTTPATRAALPAAPVLVAAALVGLVSVGLLGALVGAGSARGGVHVVSRRGSRSRVSPGGR